LEIDQGHAKHHYKRKKYCSLECNRKAKRKRLAKKYKDNIVEATNNTEKDLWTSQKNWYEDLDLNFSLDTFNKTIRGMIEQGFNRPIEKECKYCGETIDSERLKQGKVKTCYRKECSSEYVFYQYGAKTLYEKYNNECANCGYSKVLDIHHLDEDADRRGETDDWRDIVINNKRFVVLCPNCHHCYHRGKLSKSEIEELYREDSQVSYQKVMDDAITRARQE
jgi:hypothetical protein